MRYSTFVATFVLLAVGAAADVLIGQPDSFPTRVGPDGAIYEDWGSVILKIESPPGAQTVSQQYQVAPAPTVVTKTAAGSVTLTETVYRAPLWPLPLDVLSAHLENTGDDDTTVRLKVALPEGTSADDGAGQLGGRSVITLPADIRPERRGQKSWGCTGGVTPLPGWARPSVECDPAFRNISAGMGGVPITYQFSVPPGEARTVVLGFCESHWGIAGRRPVGIDVEGAPKSEIDPVEEWGQHVPGCLLFTARDLDGDGLLRVSIAPHPKASDKNTILNVIWVFELDVPIILDEVKAGALSKKAEYYVDVGGQKDQPFYESGPIVYELKLASGEQRELTFLLACPGGRAGNLAGSAWTPAKMRRAAEDVWRDWFAQSASKDLLAPSAEATRQALAGILLWRFEADGYFAALPEPGKLGAFSHAKAAEMIAALDAEGLYTEARRMLRVYWDKPVPGPFASLAQGEDGQWEDPAKDPCAHGFALQALTGHALATQDRGWAEEVWPAIEAGVAWLAKPETQAALSAEAKKAAADGLLGVAEAAGLLGRDDAAKFEKMAEGLTCEP